MSLINSLSFSPQRVLKVEPSKDSVKQKIYNEYLNEAFNEVEQKMGEIHMKNECLERSSWHLYFQNCDMGINDISNCQLTKR